MNHQLHGQLQFSNILSFSTNFLELISSEDALQNQLSLLLIFISIYPSIWSFTNLIHHVWDLQLFLHTLECSLSKRLGGYFKFNDLWIRFIIVIAIAELDREVFSFPDWWSSWTLCGVSPTNRLLLFSFRLQMKWRIEKTFTFTPSSRWSSLSTFCDRIPFPVRLTNRRSSLIATNGAFNAPQC